MFSPAGVIINFRKPLFIRLAILAFVLFLFWQRISVGFTSLYTYIVFTFAPAPVLGNDDGWDLVNLIPPANASQSTPRIIHQVRLGNLKMKDTWIEANTSCVALNKPEDGWRYELWDTERANAFVAEEYPDLLNTYLGYPQGVPQYLCCVATRSTLMLCISNRNSTLRFYKIPDSVQIWWNLSRSRREMQNKSRLLHDRRLGFASRPSRRTQQRFHGSGPWSPIPPAGCE